MAFSFKPLHFLYPSLCIHCKESTDAHFQVLCPTCFSLLSLHELERRCLTCFSLLESRFCSVCCKRQTLLQRQIATCDKMGAGGSLLKEALSGNLAVFPAIASLMAYQWTRLQLPWPDLIVPLSCSWIEKWSKGFDPNHHLVKLLAKSLKIPSCLSLKKQQDWKAFFEEGLISSCFLCKNGKQVTDKRVLFISLFLDDGLIQKGAKALNAFFPEAIYSLSFASD